MKTLFFLLSLSLISSSYALDVPSFQVLLDGQLKCNDSEIKKIPWETAYKDFSLANRTVTIISDMDLKEKNPAKQGDKKSRDFVFKYKVYAQITCGEEIDLINDGKGKSFEDQFTLAVAEKNPNKIDFFQENEHKPLEYYLSHSDNPLGGESTSAPARPGFEGLSCLVKLSDFVANPYAQGAIKNICTGSKKGQAAKMKLEIGKLQKKLKNLK